MQGHRIAYSSFDPGTIVPDTESPKPPEIVRQTSGPFKGRVYERKPGGGLVRRQDLETADRILLRRRQLEELHRQAVQSGRPRGKRRPTYEEIVDEVTRNPRASDAEEASSGEQAAETAEAVPVSVESEDQAG